MLGIARAVVSPRVPALRSTLHLNRSQTDLARHVANMASTESSGELARPLRRVQAGELQLHIESFGRPLDRYVAVLRISAGVVARAAAS